MEKIQGLAAAILNNVTEHAHAHGLSNNEVMNALAHAYVIYGFTVKKDDTSVDELKTALVGCVVASADHMAEVQNEKA